MAPEGDHVYHPKAAVKEALKGAAVTGTAGFLFAAIQNTLTRNNYGAFGVFTKYGGTAATFTAVGGVYEFTKIASANLREKDDAYNAALGGFFAGSIIGLRNRTVPMVLGWGALTAVILGTYELTGGAIYGNREIKEIDEFEYKQKLRANKRRPIQETIDELGEGRGIHAPGWEERRRERIKAAYGIDVPGGKS